MLIVYSVISGNSSRPAVTDPRKYESIPTVSNLSLKLEYLSELETGCIVLSDGSIA